jgi:hypothetical protein
MSKENEAIVRRFFNELWNTENVDAVDDLMDIACDGDFSFSPVGRFPGSAEEAFSFAQSPSYPESRMAVRIEEFSESHPELAKVILKGLIIRREGNFRGIVKWRAKTFRDKVHDVQCTVDELITQGDMVWARWTLRGTFQLGHVSSDAMPRSVTITGASIFLIRDGKIQDYRSQSITTDRWFESVVGLVPRP